MFEETKAEKTEEEIGNLHLKPCKVMLATMILTLDADTVAYATASVCEAGDDEAGYTLDLDYALAEACSRVDNILEHSGCGSVELHFTTGKNFRFTLTDTYKANRGGTRTPAGLQDLKIAMLTKYTGMLHTDIEADDHVSWQKRFWPEKYIVGSPDKDVYNGNVGIHFNYYKRAKGKYILEDIPMKWVATQRIDALVWTHMQVLMGDSSDGIAGIHRCGPAKALKILCPEIIPELELLKKAYKLDSGKAIASDKLWTKLVIPHGLLGDVIEDRVGMWKSVVDAYVEAGMSEKEAILNMRLVNMHQINEEGDLELWTQPIQIG